MALQTRFSMMSNLSTSAQDTLFQFSQGPKTSVSHSTVHSAFESVVDSHPTALAAIYADQQLTYIQLDLAANRLSHYLISSGLRPRQRVCLVVQRSLEMLIGLLAILKAGCQYVPIDGGVVSDQALRHILEDTEARFILCLPRFWDRVTQFANKQCVVLELGMETGAFYDAGRPGVEVSADDGVYAMYTSGSTGVPKGVDVPHRTMLGKLLLEPGRMGMGVGSKVAQVLSISFAMGAWEMLGSLVNGATLYLRGSDWNATLVQVDTLICTPSILSKYPQQEFPNIKTVAVAGEACPQTLADDWAQGRQLSNFLGSTEVFLVSAHAHIPGKPLSIGRPLPNTRCYVLDDAGAPLPVGEKGNLWVGGAGVSKGYINLPLTTAEKFRPDNFVDDGNATMFNFGNVVCWEADGSLISFGRMDDQVKIKGFRIELEGVTAITEIFPDITRATSLVIDDVLHGFYASLLPIDEQALQCFMRLHLPYYSVPERWTRVSDIPLNSNGKVDRALLKATVARLSTNVEPHEPEDKWSNPDVGTTTKATELPPTTPQDTIAALPNQSGRGEVEHAMISNSEVSACMPEGLKSESPNTGPGVKTLSPLPPKHDFQTLLKGFALGKESHSGSSDLESSSSNPEGPRTDALPEVQGFPTLSWLRHRVFIAYRWLLIPIACANIAVACWLLNDGIKSGGYPLSKVGHATAANLCAAILIRSEPVINILFTIFSSVPTSAPLAIRRICANVYHIGGIHVGCAIAAIIWFIIFTAGASIELGKDADSRVISLAPTILSYCITFLLLSMTLLSIPTLRNKYHDAWEYLHRFGGWSVLILYWALVSLSTKDLARGSELSTTQAYVRNPSIWLLTIATIAIIFPWLFLRKVRIRSEYLSSHAIRLHFDSPIVPGKGVRLAQHPLRDWHGFATIQDTDNVDTKGTTHSSKAYSVIISRAGDFTGRIIDTAPTHIWRRGIPTCGFLRVATLFRSVVIVATGSGIGPCLSIFPYQRITMRILWTAPNHEATFGKSIVEEVKSRDSNAVLYNTRTLGKPDMSLLAWRLYRESGAEAVLVISNRRLTREIVFQMERRGVPAYGAIFDS